MIKSFADKYTKELFETGDCKNIPPEIKKRAIIKLELIHNAENLTELTIPPANRLEKLKGELEGFYSIRINNRFRIIFKFENNNAYNVSIVDYHK